MKWIETINELPEINSVVLVEFYSGSLEWKPYTGPQDWWKRNIRRFLSNDNEFIIDDNVQEITSIMRDADKAFEKIGGSTRHYIRDVFIPLLNENGFHFCKKTNKKA